MVIGFNGKTYSNDEYSKITKTALLALERLKLGKPLNTVHFIYINEYASLSRPDRAESLFFLCKKLGAKKFLLNRVNGKGMISFYVINGCDINKAPKYFEVVSIIEEKTIFDEILFLLKNKKEVNITELSTNVHKFKMLRKMERKNLLDYMQNEGLIKIKIREKSGINEFIVSLKEKADMNNEMKAKTKSEELIEQANKLLAAAEEAKKEEEKQLSKHEIMNIQREINVEIIEMEKQIDGMIDSFSKLKSLFDKLKQS